MKKTALLIIFLFIPFISFATTTNFTLGKQYKAITPTNTNNSTIENHNGKVSVVEFFSYGCPWCFHLEKPLEAWLKHKPDYVSFTRIPVVFETGWDTYAKAYYTASALGILNTITPALFKAIHVKNQDLTSTQAMKTFFKEHGVSNAEFNSAFNESPSLPLEMKNGQNLMMAYKVFQIPTIIVAGKYYTNPKLTNGDNQLMVSVVKYLVNKEKPKGAK